MASDWLSTCFDLRATYDHRLDSMAKEDAIKALVEKHVSRLLKAYCDRSSVVIRYVSESEPEPSDFVLFPNRIFERDDSVYGRGMVGPQAEKD